MVQYSYDAWGKPISTTASSTLTTELAELNPFRYRGYVWDEETELHYLNLRYYNLEICRFVSSDDSNVLNENSGIIEYNLFSFCKSNPVNRFDSDGQWSLPNWAKVAIGAVAIVGLAVATVCTGGAAAVVCGAALSGACTGGISGAVIGAISGGINDGWEGALDGACSGFLSGTIIGGIGGAASAGFNIATGTTTIVGKAHGSLMHKLASNVEAGKMAASGKYSQVGLNKALKTLGLNGSKRPDVIGVARCGANKLVEIVSPSQTIASIEEKMNTMLYDNPGSVGKVVKWVKRLFS